VVVVVVVVVIAAAAAAVFLTSISPSMLRYPTGSMFPFSDA